MPYFAKWSILWASLDRSQYADVYAGCISKIPDPCESGEEVILFLMRFITS
jgi:hypothetical protein